MSSEKFGFLFFVVLSFLPPHVREPRGRAFAKSYHYESGVVGDGYLLMKITQEDDAAVLAA
ncbi:MAG TPA: hypothetical protein VL346_00215 [Acidobacteriaceae bacterium]|nr:hypothetical protein [Acidobacteriaceae bacterium]